MHSEENHSNESFWSNFFGEEGQGRGEDAFFCNSNYVIYIYEDFLSKFMYRVKYFVYSPSSTQDMEIELFGEF